MTGKMAGRRWKRRTRRIMLPPLNQKLFSSCPVLEELSISALVGFGKTINGISSPALKTLYISLSLLTRQYRNSETVIMVDAPILECLHVKDNCLVLYCLKSLSSLVKASVCVEAPYPYAFSAITQVNQLFGLLKAISNVHLHLKASTMAALGFANDKNWPAFPNLIQLELGVCHNFCCKSLFDLLNGAPNLCTMVFAKSNSIGLNHKGCQVKKLKSLADASQDELNLIKYLVKNVDVLTKMTIRNVFSSMENENEFLKELVMAPRLTLDLHRLTNVLVVHRQPSTPDSSSSHHCEASHRKEGASLFEDSCRPIEFILSTECDPYPPTMTNKSLPHKVDGKRKRGESRSKTKPDQTAVPEEVNMKKVNYRSNITGLVKLLKDTKFTSGQLKCLRKTPFWPLFDSLISNEIDLNHCMKYDDIIVRIVQTFKQSSGRFYIGDKNIQIFRSDVSLIFGVDCGTKSMDLSYGAKPTTGIIHRMCKDVSRLSAAKIREILREALKGTKKHDNEEVARLVCMYACVKLFFSTSGETIGWVFYSYMDPLHKMIEYDWAESIRATLMGSLGQNCEKPGRVTGCVMLLMYWLYEHTTILQPHNPNAIPRCVKWDLTALHSNMKSITLAKLGLNEVYGGELMASPTEAKIYRHTKLNVESSAVAKKDESNEDQSKDSQRSDDRDAFSVDAVDLNDVGHYINPSCSTPNAEKGIIIAQPTKPDIVEVLIKENQKAWALVRQWEAKYKQLEESWELRARVIAALEAKLFDQSGSSNVDMDMKTYMEWKDTEIQRLTKLVINLECEKTILEDLFDDQSVHIITQVEAQKAHDSLNNNPTAALEHVISPPSRVKRIKQKVRKEHRLDEFEYPNLPGQKKGKEGAEQQSHAVQIAQDLDKQPPKKQPTKSKKLTLNNKLKVWANMNKLNKQKVQNLHKNGGDE
ncbi:hypothetical protein TEA_011034 [Camellia sinensis var. sinensis]|uniref:Aminotransferase-like plant mobile domain-containing protein n=1 Tax=Camellia sinensis var. sinensis TaxID=542762 RepID=A0A4V3WL54_CAMSN|nr:hypothetical protein TEA_011034 [Camellia sinensis var. sinensis]